MSAIHGLIAIELKEAIIGTGGGGARNKKVIYNIMFKLARSIGTGIARLIIIHDVIDENGVHLGHRISVMTARKNVIPPADIIVNGLAMGVKLLADRIGQNAILQRYLIRARRTAGCINSIVRCKLKGNMVEDHVRAVPHVYAIFRGTCQAARTNAQMPDDFIRFFTERNFVTNNGNTAARCGLTRDGEIIRARYRAAERDGAAHAEKHDAIGRANRVAE